MDTGFADRRDSESMTEDNHSRAKNNLEGRLNHLFDVNYDLRKSLDKAKGYLKDVLNGVYCIEDIEGFLKG